MRLRQEEGINWIQLGVRQMVGGRERSTRVALEEREGRREGGGERGRRERGGERQRDLARQ